MCHLLSQKVVPVAPATLELDGAGGLKSARLPTACVPVGTSQNFCPFKLGAQSC